MCEKIIKELNLEDITLNLLDSFNRYQSVTKGWSNKNGSWTLIDQEYTVNWDEIKKREIVEEFKKILLNKEGNIFGAFLDGKLIAFSVLSNKKFGTEGQYLQIDYLHVSNEYRHQGIRKKLFELCIKKAKMLNGKKIYISANDSEATQDFYLGLGCKDAIEVNKASLEKEPYDRQMEYIIM